MNLTHLIMTTTLAISAVLGSVQGMTHRGNQTHVTTFGNKTSDANAAPRPTGRLQHPALSLTATNQDRGLARRLLGSTSCTCGGDSIYPYETIPKSNPQGAYCTGGCSGNKFVVHRYLSSVRDLRVWVTQAKCPRVVGIKIPCKIYNGFQAIQVVFFNGNQETIGSLPSGEPDKSFTFEAGELLDGVVTMGGNGDHGMAGYLHFKTNKAHEFSVGTLHTPYYFEATGSLLAGFFGRENSAVAQLGLLLYKTVKSIQIADVKYPTLDSYLSGLTPTQIVDRPYCNDGPTDQKEIKTSIVSIGTKKVWSLSVTETFELSVGIEVTAGAPEVEQTKETMQWKWGISATASYSMETNTLDTKQDQLQITYPAHSRGHISYTQFDSNINVPWEGMEYITFKDGTSMTMNVHGTYNGVYVSKIVPEFEIKPCNPCNCGVTPPSPNPHPSPMPTSPPPAPSASGCRRSCIGLVFGPKSSRAGQAVCAAEECSPQAPYVDVTGFGCSANPNFWKSTCCDTRLC